ERAARRRPGRGTGDGGAHREHRRGDPAGQPRLSRRVAGHHPGGRRQDHRQPAQEGRPLRAAGGPWCGAPGAVERSRRDARRRDHPAYADGPQAPRGAARGRPDARRARRHRIRPGHHHQVPSRATDPFGALPVDSARSLMVDRLISPLASGEDDEPLQTALRPRTLDEFIGQDAQRRRLSIALQAARQRGDALEHLLLSGPPGLGKTTLAHIVAHEMGGNLITTSGPALERTADLVGMLTGLEHRDVFFIDEIHRMPRVVEEYLYPAMEDFKVDFIIEKGPYARAYPITVKPFTLVGATTRKGLLSSPL